MNYESLNDSEPICHAAAVNEELEANHAYAGSGWSIIEAKEAYERDDDFRKEIDEAVEYRRI